MKKSLIALTVAALIPLGAAVAGDKSGQGARASTTLDANSDGRISQAEARGLEHRVLERRREWRRLSRQGRVESEHEGQRDDTGPGAAVGACVADGSERAPGERSREHSPVRHGNSAAITASIHYWGRTTRAVLEGRAGFSIRGALTHARETATAAAGTAVAAPTAAGARAARESALTAATATLGRRPNDRPAACHPHDRPVFRPARCVDRRCVVHRRGVGAAGADHRCDDVRGAAHRLLAALIRRQPAPRRSRRPPVDRHRGSRGPARAGPRHHHRLHDVRLDDRHHRR